MKILQRYILSELLYYFGLFSGVLLVVYFIVTLFDAKDLLLTKKPELMDVFAYTVLSLPTMIGEMIPLVGLLAVLFALGLMVKNREILAMGASGLSFAYLSVPVIIYGIFVGACSHGFNEYLGPKCYGMAKDILKVKIKQENQFTYQTNQNIFMKGPENSFILITQYNEGTHALSRVSMLYPTDDYSGLKKRIDAPTGYIKAAPHKEREVWELHDGEEWIFHGNREFDYTVDEELRMIEFDGQLRKLLAREREVEELTVTDLGYYIGVLRTIDSPHRLYKYRTLYHVKMARSFACIFLALIGYMLAADLRVTRFSVVFSKGIVLGMLYYLMQEGARLFNKGDILDAVLGPIAPVVAGWFSVIVFAGVSVYLFWKLERA